MPASVASQPFQLLDQDRAVLQGGGPAVELHFAVSAQVEDGGGGGGAVDSFNARTGAVVPVAGDYSSTQISDGTFTTVALGLAAKVNASGGTLTNGTLDGPTVAYSPLQFLQDLRAGVWSELAKPGTAIHLMVRGKPMPATVTPDGADPLTAFPKHLLI